MLRGCAAVFILSWVAGALLLNLSTASTTAFAAILALAVSRLMKRRPVNSAFARSTADATRTPKVSAVPDLPRPLLDEGEAPPIPVRPQGRSRRHEIPAIENQFFGSLECFPPPPPGAPRSPR
ncbi:MAG: hypothetical protein ABI914_06235 [Acidobacteriota bacterium]